ncbi:hypothetical protein B0A50_08333 [Salinomyces thailandicus]|uniref:Uncharacterized protein n=1 Tax=Salinomyces thailandicus TaxID=706561 RepID=A0A4U0TK61_9PEZI|nr:hypothetical protein B0A50_08333 [Salinomyces thailandica]
MQPAGSRLAGLVSAHAVLRLAESRIRGKEGRPQDDQIAVPVPSGTNMPVEQQEDPAEEEEGEEQEEEETNWVAGTQRATSWEVERT